MAGPRSSNGTATVSTVVQWLDSTGCAVAGYTLLVLVTVCLGLLERAAVRSGRNTFYWPTFWFVTALLLAAMAIGRAGETGEFLADIGRRQAESEGWYESRRSVQAVVVGTIAGTWAIVVLVAIWRVPERRRRYLPTALFVFTIVCYAGARIVSLHQLDALLHNRRIGGLTIGGLVELTLLSSTFLVIACRVPSVGSPSLDVPPSIHAAPGD